MTTETDLANRALAHIGEMRIADINDTGSKEARTCKSFVQSVIDETLREHRWHCAISRATLVRLSEAPNHGFEHAYQLPGDYLRLLEVNGEEFDPSDEYHSIEEDKRLLTDSTEAKIRYVRRVTVSNFDPLLAAAVSAALAAEICIPLNLNVQMQQALEAKKARAISKAKRVNAIEVGSREVPSINRLLGNSPLVQSRFYGRRSVDPLRFRIP